VLVRRDLAYFGQFGIPGKGYSVPELKEKILKILGIDAQWKIALIGAGNLGTALLTYKGFKERGFEIVAVFDNDKRKIGSVKQGLKIQDINRLKQIVKSEKIKMAVIALPVAPAQEVVDRVIDSGIKTILNFAPIKLKIPDSVDLLNIDMTIELERLSYLATLKK
jgi:redox-sensing transcriptional repressor